MNKISENENSSQNQAQFEFSEMQLKVGDKLQLKLRSNTNITCCSNNGGFCMVTLIGYVPNKTLMVTMPKSDLIIGQPLIEGDQFMVRLFSGQSAFSFTVFVESIVRKPFNYLHLSFPTQILGQTIRKSRRIKTNIQTVVNGTSSHTIITNLSVTGAEIRTQTDLGEPGTAIELSFEMEFEEKSVSLQLESVIRSFRITQGADLLLSYGVEFINLQSEQAFALRSFIYQELVRNPVQII